MQVSRSSVLFPWSSFHTLVPLVLGIAGLVAFILCETFKTESPLIPLCIFVNRTTAVNYIGTFIHGIALWCLLYCLPLYYEAVKAYSPMIVGVAVFPETFIVALRLSLSACWSASQAASADGVQAGNELGD